MDQDLGFEFSTAARIKFEAVHGFAGPIGGNDPWTVWRDLCKIITFCNESKPGSFEST